MKKEAKKENKDLQDVDSMSVEELENAGALISKVTVRSQ